MNGVFIDSSVFLDFLERKERAKALLVVYSGLITKYCLHPNDALIAATCKHYGIKKIATFDPDFKRVDFLEIITQE